MTRRSAWPDRRPTVNDLKRVTTGDQQRMYVLVTLGVYAILVAPAPAAMDLPLPDRHGGAGLPGLAWESPNWSSAGFTAAPNPGGDWTGP